MPCFTAMRAEIALMSGSAFAVTHHAFSSGAGRTSDGNGSHASTLKSPSYTKSVSWQHYRKCSVLLWGNPSRPVVAELGDDSGWHFFSQRNPDNSIVFTVNGQVIPLNYGNFECPL
ncbi:putative IS1 encoded protein [Shigella flexneri 6603-63]|nr:putative IS1 encoded protein [Shigella flexneri 6603-63]